MTTRLRGLVSGVRSDRMLTNSAMLFTTSLLMAGFGALFWVLAARLSDARTVGLAGTVVAASDTLALFAQLGLNIALVRTMPRSRHPAADVIASAALVGSVASVLALGYVLLLPLTSPQVQEVLHSPWAAVLFCVLVAATAVNVLSDNVFLAINQVRSYLWLNGVLLGVAKCTLLFALAGAGVLGLYGSTGGAALLCGVASMVVILRHLPRPTRLRPSAELLHARGFAGAGYLTVVLALTPQMVLPLLVVNELGAEAGAYFFVSMQVIALQNAVVVTIGNSMFAEAERHPEHLVRTVRRGGVAIAVAAVLSALAMVLVAPLLLSIFGPEYVEEGTATLRILALSVPGLGLAYWAAMRLRIAHHPRAMVGAQLCGTTVILGSAGITVPHGTTWVAAGLGIGYLVAGVAGLLISRLVAPLHDQPTPTRSRWSRELARPARPGRERDPAAAAPRPRAGPAGLPHPAPGPGLRGPRDRGQRGRGGARAAASVRRRRGLAERARRAASASLPDHVRLRRVPKVSAAGLWAYLRSEAVFFTHGLYGSPRPSRRKPLVNLWHGDGPKATRPGKGAGGLIPSTWLVSGTRLFGELKAAAFELPPDRLLVTGNPRTDQLWRPASSAALARLGITGPFVLWMPTFRATRRGGLMRAWSEGGSRVGLDDVAPLLDHLEACGMQLVVKPHPLDAEERRGPGVLTRHQ